MLTQGLRAAIFDLDGLIVDSEPIWLEAETHVFARVGVRMTPELSGQTLGMRPDEAVRHHFRREPWTGTTPDELVVQLIDRFLELAHERATIMPGVQRALEMIRERIDLVAVASSSPRRVIDAIIGYLGLGDSFRVLCSAEDEEFGKPHPAVFIRAAAALGVAPSSCLVFEDSLAGVIAAKAARMAVVAVPHSAQRDDPRFALADLRLLSLAELEPAQLAHLGL